MFDLVVLEILKYLVYSCVFICIDFIFVKVNIGLFFVILLRY